MRGSDRLNQDIIKANLGTKRIGRKIVVFSSTSSTNDVAAEYAKNKINDGLVVLAEEQTKGRGRAGNKWITARADSIICSILLSDCNLNPELLSLTCAVAVAEAIGRCAKSRAKIKWPNDIILNGKKVAGILVESKPFKKRIACIIGIGINCHQSIESLPPELRQTATSIDIESGTICDRNSLTKRLLTSFDHWLEKAGDDPAIVIDHWKKLSTQLGHRLSVIYNKRKFTGHCIGLDPQHGLVLQLDTGGIRMFHAAQTTVAKE